MGGREEASSFHYLYSCDLETCFRVKVGGLEGKLPRIEYEQIIENPMLKFAGRAQSSSPDLLVEAVVRGGQGDLHLPVHTAYKNMNHRWAWNQWLELPVMFSDLPSDALLCFTVFDCTGPGEREAVGGSSISVFGKKGVLRSGMMDLVVWPSTAGGADTPGKVVDSDKEQYHRLAKLTKKYHAGKIPAIDWLDRLAFAEMERIGQREKAASAKMYLNVEFPQTVDMGLPIAVVYFEAGGDRQVAAPPSSALVTLPDPEIGLENLVEAKHHRLARSARTGIYERDLKPNPEVRNRLTQVLGTPTTQPLTGEELDLIWRYRWPLVLTLTLTLNCRYYLAQNKKAMAKFVKCVNWSVVVEAEQAMELIRAHWAPMDVEDALELVGPNWQHPDLRRWAEVAGVDGPGLVDVGCGDVVETMVVQVRRGEAGPGHGRGPAALPHAAGPGWSAQQPLTWPGPQVRGGVRGPGWLPDPEGQQQRQPLQLPVLVPPGATSHSLLPLLPTPPTSPHLPLLSLDRVRGG